LAVFRYELDAGDFPGAPFSNSRQRLGIQRE
jgi:hypothetical protein